MAKRPAIVNIEGDIEGDDARVTVVLSYEDDRFFGQALGNSSPTHRARLAGEAALRAVESITGPTVRLELLAIAAADLGEAQVALAQVRLDGGEILVGSALMRKGDPEQAAAKAVLDALNRRLGLII
jgi:hypothetical protein